MQEFFKKNRRILIYMAFGFSAIFLASCSRAELEPITPHSEGFWDSYIIYPLSQFILWLSQIFSSYGLGVIAFTALGRIILIPLTIYQQNNMEKMSEIQPKLKELQEQYSARDEETQMKLREEMARVQEEAGVSTWSSFLPLLVQMPIFIALYQTVLRTPELANGQFLWMELGSPDPYFIVPILAATFTAINSWLMQYGRPQGTGKFMLFFMAGMILLLTIGAASSLAIYFATTNFIAILTILIFSNPFKKKELREAEEAAEREKERRRKAALRKAKKTGRSVKK